MHQSSKDPQINEMKQSEFFKLVQMALLPKSSEQNGAKKEETEEEDQFSKEV